MSQLKLHSIFSTETDDCSRLNKQQLERRVSYRELQLRMSKSEAHQIENIVRYAAVLLVLETRTHDKSLIAAGKRSKTLVRGKIKFDRDKVLGNDERINPLPINQRSDDIDPGQSGED